MSDSSKKPDRKSHTISDHQYGEDFYHSHDDEEGADHDHDDFAADGSIENNPIWIADNVSLLSVGIDIGSPGTPGGIFRPALRRPGDGHFCRRNSLPPRNNHQTPGRLTPLQNQDPHSYRSPGRILEH